MGQMAAEDDVAARKLALSLKNATGATEDQIAAVEDWITQTSLATGVTDDELRPALSKLAIATGDVSKAQELLSLGMDVAAGRGKSLEQVTEALMRAQTGNLGSLGRLGIATKNAAGETLTFQQIQKDLATQFAGQSAQAADTTAGKFARMKVALAEAGEELGYKLLPYATRFANWMVNDGIPGIERLVGWLRDKLGPVVSRVSEWFSGADDKGGDLSGTMRDLGGFVDNAKRAWSGLQPFIKQAAQTLFPLLMESVKGTARNLKLMSDAAIWMWNNAFGPSLKSSTKAFAVLLESVADTLDILGSIPGAPAWIGRTADKAHVAAARINEISNSIKKIPRNVPVTVTVTYNYKGLQGPGGAGPTRGHGDDNLGGGRIAGRGGVIDILFGKGAGKSLNLEGVGKNLMASIVRGIQGKKKALKDVLAGVRDQIRQFAEDRKGIIEQMRGFSSSVFSADFTDPETGQSTATPQKILDFAKAQRDKAIRLRDAVKRLISGGMSRNLIEQMLASGESGQAAIEAMASGSNAQIGELNAINAETMAALDAAGVSAADALQGDQVAALKRVEGWLERITNSLEKGEEASIKLHGDTLEAVFRKRERKTGRRLLVSPG